ncbi:MAG: Hsp20/alpha crystallin family protein [Candidatus Kapabacteria bacterium]|nr:Hsp20/alpha crystallin family protein [Ignavibacteriota bacterium]MCW5884657.1 Hsp20/alpha crystallin family protein [Candidatus Kapabacteria bacterium]
MTLAKYDPYRGYGNLTRRMKSLINTFDPQISFETGGFLPRVDISESEKQLYIQAEMPGLCKEDFKLTVSDDKVLILKGTKKRESEESNDENGLSYHRIERSSGEFTRSFALPDYVDGSSINAKFENGVLTISFNKIVPAQPKEIEISVS